MRHLITSPSLSADLKHVAKSLRRLEGSTRQPAKRLTYVEASAYDFSILVTDTSGKQRNRSGCVPERPRETRIHVGVSLNQPPA
jgi:hypothetical protein